jgi:hypothetical protein
MMWKWWVRRVHLLASGAVTLGLLQGIEGVSLNQIWFQFLATWLSAIISILFGGDLSQFNNGNGGGGSFF